MRIVYDHQIFYQQSYGGISRYFSKLISEMNELQCEVKLFAPAHNNEYLADFKKHFNEVWLPEHAPKYFETRDAKALSLITTIMLPSPGVL